MQIKQISKQKLYEDNLQYSIRQSNRPCANNHYNFCLIWTSVLVSFPWVFLDQVNFSQNICGNWDSDLPFLWGEKSSQAPFIIPLLISSALPCQPKGPGVFSKYATWTCEAQDLTQLLVVTTAVKTWWHIKGWDTGCKGKFSPSVKMKEHHQSCLS